MTATGSPSLVEQARDIAELAGRRAEKAEAARTPDLDVIDALVAAGAARHFVPMSLGGSGGTFAELKQAAVVIGEQCPATAWCTVVAGLMTRAAACLAGGGTATAVGGRAGHPHRRWCDAPGRRGSGAGRLVALRILADGVLVGAGPLDPADRRRGRDRRVRAAGVPGAARRGVRRSDLGRRRDAGDRQPYGGRRAGLRPGHTDLSRRLSSPSWTPQQRARTVARCRCLAVNTFLFCLPMLGAARGALRHWKRLTGAKLRARPGAYDPMVAHYADVFARSSGETDAAGLLLDRVAQVVDTAPVVTRSDVARNQRDCAFAAELLVRAVDRLMRASGTGGHSTGSVLQRLWRDIHTAGSHAALQFGPAAA
ncbi:hydrolase [Streptomyces lasalocidi]